MIPSQLRKSWQANEINLSVYSPKFVETGTYTINPQIHGLADDVAENWYYYSFHRDTYTNFQPIVKNQTVYFYSDTDYIGKSRVHHVDGDDIYFQISEHILVASGTNYQIVDFHELWPKFPRAVFESGTVSYYKDYDIAYSNQNTNFVPVAVFGPNLASYESILGQGLPVTLDATKSYTVDNTTITNYLWTLPTGTIIVPGTGDITDPSLTPILPIGHNTIKLDVTNNLGITGTTFRHFSIYNRPDVPNGLYPISDWKLDSLTGDFDTGDWTAKITVRERAEEFIDGALVVIWTESRTKEIGEQPATYSPVYRENILFVGYVIRIENKYDSDGAEHSVLLKSALGILNNKDMFSVSLESVENPIDWTQMHDMTINKIVNHYLYYHSTLLETADLFKIPTLSGDYYEEMEDIPRGQITNNIRMLLQDRLFGNIVSNKCGQIYTEVNVNLLLTALRPNTEDRFTKDDWIGAETVPEMFEMPLSSILLGGIGYDLVTGTAYLSKAPDAQFPAPFGKPETKSRMNVTSQAECNLLSGLYFGYKNNPYPSVDLSFGNNFQFIDIAPQTLWLLDDELPFTEKDSRNLVLRWKDRRIIPRKINISWDNWVLTERVTFETETNGTQGETIVIPVIPKDNPPITPPIPPGGGGTTGTTGWVIMTSTDDDNMGINGYIVNPTNTFGNTSPYWRIGYGNGATDGCVDPFDETQNIAFYTTGPIVVRVTNLKTTPSYSTVLNKGTGWQMERVVATIAQNGVFWVLGYHTHDGQIDQYVFRTENSGQTWEQLLTCANVSAHNRAFGCGQHNPKICYLSGNQGSPDAPKVISNYKQIGFTYGVTTMVNDGLYSGGIKWETLDDPYFVYQYQYLPNNNPPEITGTKFTRYIYQCDNPVTSVDVTFYSLYDGKPLVGFPCGSAEMNPIIYTPNDPVHNETYGVNNFAIGYQVEFAGRWQYNCGHGSIRGVGWTINKINGSNVGTPYTYRIKEGNGGALTIESVAAFECSDVECYYNKNEDDLSWRGWSASGEFWDFPAPSKGGSDRVILTADPSDQPKRMICHVLDSNKIFVLAANAGKYDIKHFDISLGGAWTTTQIGLDGGCCIGLWPFGTTDPNVQALYVGDKTHIYYSLNGGRTLMNKTGNLTLTNGTTCIVPLWLSY